MKVALVTIGRLENRYAVEFVEYYKQLGFDHIFIADNNHEGEEHFEDVLQSYIDEEYVTIFNFRNLIAYQLKAYIKIYYKISKEYDWIAFFDFDEYLTLVKDKTIKDYLSRDCFKNINQILINWKTYTDNDLVYDDGRPLIKRFTTPMDINKIVNIYLPENYHVKSIIKTNIEHIYNYNPHCFYNDILANTSCNNNGTKPEGIYKDKLHYQPINYDLSYIKHFPTKTIEEWVKNKFIKGTGDKNLNDFKRMYSNIFFIYNEKTNDKINYLKLHNINLE